MAMGAVLKHVRKGSFISLPVHMLLGNACGDIDAVIITAPITDLEKKAVKCWESKSCTKEQLTKQKPHI